MRQERASYAAAAARIRRKRDKRCLVTQAQVTAAISHTTITDKARNPKFTFLTFPNSVLSGNISCCSPKPDKLPSIKVRASCFISINAF
jgi:hypothetical protein